MLRIVHCRLLSFSAVAVCLGVAASSAQVQRPGRPPKAIKIPKQPHSKRAIEHQVEKLEEQWRRAQLSNDTGTLQKLLAEDFIGITADGLVNTKDQQVQRIQMRDLALTKMDVTDMKVKVAGRVAIVTSLVNVEGTNQGAPIAGFYRYTRVYQQQPNGTWKITNFEATRIPSAAQIRAAHNHNPMPLPIQPDSTQ